MDVAELAKYLVLDNLLEALCWGAILVIVGTTLHSIHVTLTNPR